MIDGDTRKTHRRAHGILAFRPGGHTHPGLSHERPGDRGQFRSLSHRKELFGQPSDENEKRGKILSRGSTSEVPSRVVLAAASFSNAPILSSNYENVKLSPIFTHFHTKTHPNTFHRRGSSRFSRYPAAPPRARYPENPWKNAGYPLIFLKHHTEHRTVEEKKKHRDYIFRLLQLKPKKYIKTDI